jgi:hypothetical protein
MSMPTYIIIDGDDFWTTTDRNKAKEVVGDVLKRCFEMGGDPDEIQVYFAKDIKFTADTQVTVTFNEEN